MGNIHIELFQFALLVDHEDGATILFPAKDHVLLIERNGTTVPINRGADLTLCGAGGKKLGTSRTGTTAAYKKFVVDVAEAEGQPISVPAALLNAAVPPDPALLNGRLFLTGGTLTAKECSDPAHRAPFKFKAGSFVVTDTATFTMTIPDRETFELVVNNGKGRVSLPDGSTTRITNQDGVGCDGRVFETLEEFVNLCNVLGHNGTLPTAGGGPIRPMGGETICLLARRSL